MSLRIISSTAAADGGAYAAGEGDTQLNHYLERLVKLVPVESISAYPLLSSFAASQGMWAEILVSWVLLGVTIILRWHATRGADGSPQRAAIVVASVSFVIWVGVMNGHFGATQIFTLLDLTTIAEFLQSGKEFLTVLALVVWTILVPVFYVGDEA